MRRRHRRRPVRVRGQGNIAFHLAPEYDLLVRVGGPNAAHKVYLASGEIFTHTACHPARRPARRAPDRPRRRRLPEELLSEIARCDVSNKRLSIDPQVMIIEDADKKAEAELAERIGSTASGNRQRHRSRVMRGDDVRLARDVPS